MYGLSKTIIRVTHNEIYFFLKKYSICSLILRISVHHTSHVRSFPFCFRLFLSISRVDENGWSQPLNFLRFALSFFNKFCVHRPVGPGLYIVSHLPNNEMVARVAQRINRYLQSYIPLENISLKWRRHHYQQRAAKFRSMFSTHGLWAGRVFIVPHLLWHGASVSPVLSEGPFHLVASSYTQLDTEDLYLPWSSQAAAVRVEVYGYDLYLRHEFKSYGM
jgi:hypothetical protein